MVNRCYTIAALAIAVSGTWAGETSEKLRVGLGAWYPTGELENTIVLFPDPVTIDYSSDLDPSIALYVAYEHRLSNLIGLEFNLQWTEMEVKDATTFFHCNFVSATCTANAELMPLTTSVNLYATPGKRMSLYAGPLLGYMWADLKASIDPPVSGRARADIPIDDSIIYGAVIGVDCPLGQGRWELSTSLRYLLTDLRVNTESGGSNYSLDVAPFVLSVGVAYRFGRFHR